MLLVASDRLTDHEVFIGIIHLLQVPQRLHKLTKRNLSILIDVEVADKSKD